VAVSEDEMDFAADHPRGDVHLAPPDPPGTVPDEEAEPEEAGRAPRVPVLYVGGYQRSGSTLLDRMLSRCEGFVSSGEVVHLWSRGVAGDELCGCGEPFSGCSFWGEVGRVGFGGWDALDVSEVIRLQRTVDRNRYIFFMLVPRLSSRYRSDLIRYTEILDRLYRAIGAVGGRIVVDSSKHPSTAFLLRRVPSVDLRVVHLVRDSRGVAFSLLKRVRRPEVVGERSLMFRASPWRSGIEWLASNLLFHLLSVIGTPTVLARYETLVDRPRVVLGEVLSLAGVVPTDETFAFIAGPRVSLGVDHTVAGNPMRFDRGVFELRVDRAWHEAMRPGDRSITTLLTWPLLAAYGYFRRGRT
jgi:hypothetical protein